jgi:hypothetical protein
MPMEGADGDERQYKKQNLKCTLKFMTGSISMGLSGFGITQMSDASGSPYLQFAI